MKRVLVPVCLCLSALVSPAGAADKTVEVMHYWISGSERGALDVIRSAFVQHGGTWIDNPQASNLELHRVFADRLTTGTAPTALQWQGGAELADMADIGLVEDYDAVAERNQWDSVLPETVKNAIKYKGHYFLAPTSVHSENWLFYNSALLKAAGVSPPKTIAELLSAADKLDGAGITPFSIGKTDWEAREVFVAVLISVLGPENFRQLIENRSVAVLDKPMGLDSIKTFQALARHFRPDAERPAGWAEATADVGAGRAAFIIQGDWAKGELQKLGHRAGADFGCMLVPGTETMLSIAVDTFAFPRSIGTESTEGRDRFIETVLDPKVQAGFSRIKGSIPARTDVAQSELDPCASIAEALLATPHAVMEQPIRTMSTTEVSDLHVLINRMARDKELRPEEALKALKSIFTPVASETAKTQ